MAHLLNGNLGRKEMRMLAGGVILTLSFNTNKKGAESSKFLNFSFILPYLSEMMFVDISLDCVVSQRPICGTLFRLP